MEMTERLCEIIRKRAESYTPEWSFQTEDPEIGSALAAAFAEMLAGTVKKLSGIPQKNRTAFFRELGAEIRPAVPSHGYVEFQLVNDEVEGALVEAGAAVMASDDTFPDGQAVFETCEALYVTPASITEIFQTCDRNDSIFQLFGREGEYTSPIALFSPDGSNLQQHVLYLSHEELLNIHTESSVTLTCLTQGDASYRQKYIAALTDPSLAVFEYYSGQGWISFEAAEGRENGILLSKGREQPAFVRTELGGENTFWIRLRIRRFPPFSDMALDSLRLSSENQASLPGLVVGEGGELPPARFFPFGERFRLYQEVYFGSEEALSKRGAEIVFSFQIHFENVPLETNDTADIPWEWVMKRSDIKPVRSFDVTVENVIWEYFNGSGWTRLVSDDRYGQVFSPAGGGHYRTLHFLCPRDIKRTLVNASETYYIRARIQRIGNLYKLQGNYVTPVLENTSFRYRYAKAEVRPQRCLIYNNLEYHAWGSRPGQGSPGQPFFQTGLREMALYLAFAEPPAGGPLQFYFEFEKERAAGGPPLFWEYWNGRGWKGLNPMDGTDSFSGPGVVSFTGNPDMMPKRMFGRNRYWIRVRDIEGAYGVRDSGLALPLLRGIRRNVVEARYLYRREREYFQMELYQENKSFSLMEKNIYQIRVYVDEGGHLPADERESLGRQQRLLAEQDDAWVEGRDWVEWIRVEDFSQSGPADRHFVLHPFDGKLVFGNGKYGKIPYASSRENIFADYCCGGGGYTNLGRNRIERMSRSVGYISGVTNPEPMTGGCDAETPAAAMERSAGLIRHQDRAVSARDFEQLALCAARDVQAATCFVGYDDAGKRMAGAVTLVVLQKQFPRETLYFAEVRERIRQYLYDRTGIPLLGSRRLFIVPPEPVKICLYLALHVEKMQQAFQIKRVVLERLERFFRPAGCQEDGTGQRIGSLPTVMQIQHVLHGIEGVVSIRKIMMAVYTAGPCGWVEADAESVKTHRYLLPVEGEHEIVLDAAWRDGR